MGGESRTIAQSVTREEGPPRDGDFEFTVFGPGYGESIVLHVGNGAWVIIDSCVDADGRPHALRYLESIGIDPASTVRLIVATHWHDDHVRGLAQIVRTCPAAAFCCAAALCRKEFLALVQAIQGRHLSSVGSGLREIHAVFSHLDSAGKKPTHAIANRVVFQQETCRIWALSPGDDVFQRFLASVEETIPGRGNNKGRIRSLSPNEASVALWIDAENFALLLGADLDRRGWVTVVCDSERPAGRASAFKVPHHGSQDADEPAVWNQMLEIDPVAILTPWRRGGGVLPTHSDTDRILTATRNAYVTSDGSLPPHTHYSNRVVDRTLRQSRAQLRRLAPHDGAVRLRRPLGLGRQWTVETLRNACRLADYSA